MTTRVVVRKIVLLRRDDGHVPFEEWFASLNDKSLQIAVDARLTRLADGNFGDHKSVGEGVNELRIAKGPGLRVYYGLDGEQIVVLIAGGDKGSQRKDIAKAKTLWKEYRDARKSL